MSKLVPSSKMIFQSLLGVAIISMFSSAIAQPAQVPLLSRSGDQGKPNVMFTLDDSGSMELMNMPDEMAWGVRSGGGSISFSHSVRTGFHPSETGAWPWTRNRFISTSATSLVSARWRSSSVNTLYYNPEINYTPWVQFDNVPLADANPNATRINAPYWWSSTVDLTGSSNITATWCTNGNTGCQWQNQNYAPATYFEFDGTNEWSINSYTRVRIMDSATFARSATRVDCPTVNPLVPGGKICSQAEEYQNFANWFEYYRKRMLTAIAGTSRAFAEQGNDIRLGWGRINKGSDNIDGSGSGSTLVNGVRDFQGVDRLNYFNWLFSQYGNGGTPLRRAMDQVGKYFQRQDDNGPWSTDPGNGQGADKLACRKSYHILMSDGYWNGASASGGANTNVDNQAGPLILGPGVPSYQYSPIAPFRDNNSRTLADVAMYYWNRDLNPSLENRVRQDADNPAFWQNLVQFTVGLGVNGTLDPETDYQNVIDGAIAWPNPSFGQSKIDDMWHAAVNSHGKFLSAADPDQFASALSEILRSIGARESAEGGSAVSSVTLETQSAKYIPTYKNSSWSGDVQAKRVDINGSAIAELWRASEQMPAPAARNIWLGRGGALASVPFNFTNVVATGKADASVNANMVAYMRGDRTTGEGLAFRARDPKTVLGDMINSIPTLIGSLTDEQYQFLPETASTSSARNTYRGFINYKKGRQRILFVGANDGKLHGFNADTGVEEYAFVPEGVVEKLHLPANHNYSHQYMVDGPLAEVDIHKGTWKNYLLGSLGGGGRSVFALDVTDTTNLGGATAKWEYSDPELGYVVAPMSAGLTESGHWIAVTGNGMDSNSGNASLHVLDIYNGNRLRKLTVPAGGSNGLGGVRLVKDINNIVVAAYAGDQKGNIWRFDMTGASPNDWKVGFGGAPLFTTATGAAQPVIGQPEYIDHPKGGQLVIFGTGRLYNEADVTGATSGQRAYGVWDQTAGNETSVAGDQVPTGGLLVKQEFAGTTGSTPVSYESSAKPVDYDTEWGWYLDLSLAAGQRSIYSPQLIRGFILFNTIAPGPDTGEPCDDSLALGFNVLVNALTGGSSSAPLIDTNGDGNIDDGDAPRVSTYETVADGIDRVMLGTNGTVSLQRAFGQTTVNIQGRGLERIWRILMNPPV